MARQMHQVTRLAGAYPTLPLVLDAAKLEMKAADVANEEEAPFVGGMMVVIENKDAAQQTVTITSTPSTQNRTGDQVYPIAAGSFGVLGPFVSLGWAQGDGKLHFKASAATVHLGVCAP